MSNGKEEFYYASSDDEISLVWTAGAGFRLTNLDDLRLLFSYPLSHLIARYALQKWLVHTGVALLMPSIFVRAPDNPIPAKRWPPQIWNTAGWLPARRERPVR